MNITSEEVRHIAGLSRLHVTAEDTETLRDQLNSILGYIEQLNSLDTSGIEPTSHVIPLSNVMRDDVPSASLSREAALGNAPDPTEKFYRVPRIIE